MKTTTPTVTPIQKVLARMGEAHQFVRDVLALADVMHISCKDVADALFKHDQVRLVAYMTNRLGAKDRREYASNLEALKRQAEIYRTPGRYRRDYRGFVSDLHRRAHYAVRSVNAR